MKFWKKLVLFIITIISIILSVSRYFVVRNSFIHSIQNVSKQNTNQHILEKYMFESYIVKNIQDGRKETDETITDYLKSLYTNVDNDSELVALYTEEYKKIYSNIEQIDEIDIKSILDKENDKFALRKINDKHYMLFFSHWNINNKIVYIVNIYNVEDIYEERNRQMKDVLLSDIIILMASSVVISIFSIYLTKPIKILNNTTKKISSGNFGEKVNVKSNDEIGELAKSFNIMSFQIEKKISELNLLVKQKDDFIKGFTHELKTPMTAIMGYSDMLRLKRVDEDLSKKALNYIYLETKRLESLSFKLMQLMSLSEEKIKMKFIEITDFMNKVVKMENFILTNNKIELNLEKAQVLGDNELLEVVMKNLIENASNSEPKDNKIIVCGKFLNNKYRIFVIDNGKGIAKEHIDRVTEDFYMVDKSRSKTNGGSGIGLSLVKKILDLHNSKLYIESEENIGTTVYFDLRLVKCKEGENN